MTTTTDTGLPAPAPHIAILGGGPGGYEAALVALRLGAQVTIIERQGMGGAAVLTDVVPSKTLIATAEWMTLGGAAAELGIRINEDSDDYADTQSISVDLRAVNERVRALALAQSEDIHARLIALGATIMTGNGRMISPTTIEVSERTDHTGASLPDNEVTADFVLLAVGATPRVLPTVQPDNRRILTWTQLYHLDELPTKLIVVGSGVTGAEFAGAYHALGAEVVLVSSRDRVLPGEDADAANLIEKVFTARGMTVMGRSRAQAAEVKTKDGEEYVEVTLADGRTVTGSHVLMAVGSIPNTAGIGLEEIGVKLTASGHIETDKVSRTTAPNVYAAGDCTGIFPLASVAAMQGRVAMSHALGDSVRPIKLRSVAANIFTAPEIATVGYSQVALEEQRPEDFEVTMLSLRRNPRAKMMGMREGFVKLFSTKEDGVVLGGVVVAPRASELIYPITMAVTHRLTVDDVADAFTVYPSLTGTIAEVARMGHQRIND